MRKGRFAQALFVLSDSLRALDQQFGAAAAIPPGTVSFTQFNTLKLYGLFLGDESENKAQQRFSVFSVYAKAMLVVPDPSNMAQLLAIKLYGMSLSATDMAVHQRSEQGATLLRLAGSLYDIILGERSETHACLTWIQALLQSSSSHHEAMEDYILYYLNVLLLSGCDETKAATAT